MEFNKSDCIGEKHPLEIAAYLEEIGDHEAASRFHQLGARSQAISVPFFTNDQWANTGAAIGFIPENGSSAGDRLDIVHATSMAPDEKLQGASLKITLDRFYVHNYPGSGRHEILCEFTGKNQAGSKSEEMRFALKTIATDGSAAPLLSLPIFVGVNVGNDGLSFEGRTINVRSGGTDMLVEALDNSAFKEGLSLLTTAQPVLVPFVQLAKGVVRAIEKQGNNRPVFSFGLGLDFSKTATSAKLRLGSYVVVQTNEVGWNWSDFVFSRQSGTVAPKLSGAPPIALNYMIFGVTRAAQAAP
ncbi:hypothetical protein NKH60_32265 [Mesorhizobium sp. M1006]|uniref:hypothetical protein n=1 Tax=Mesorhizobium sp. M1006 TaxID=2957048 RepID=UPI0033392E67